MNHYMSNKSFGEIRVGLEDGGDGMGHCIKKEVAHMINTLRALRNDEVSTYQMSPEAKEFYSGEKLRLLEKAIDAFEIAEMWAEKAINFESVVPEGSEA